MNSYIFEWIGGVTGTSRTNQKMLRSCTELELTPEHVKGTKVWKVPIIETETNKLATLRLLCLRYKIPYRFNSQ